MLTAFDGTKHTTYTDLFDYENNSINESQDIHGYDSIMDQLMMQKVISERQETSLILLYQLEPQNNPSFNPNLIA